MKRRRSKRVRRSSHQPPPSRLEDHRPPAEKAVSRRVQRSWAWTKQLAAAVDEERSAVAGSHASLARMDTELRAAELAAQDAVRAADAAAAAAKHDAAAQLATVRCRLAAARRDVEQALTQQQQSLEQAMEGEHAQREAQLEAQRKLLLSQDSAGY